MHLVWDGNASCHIWILGKGSVLKSKTRDKKWEDRFMHESFDSAYANVPSKPIYVPINVYSGICST